MMDNILDRLTQLLKDSPHIDPHDNYIDYELAAKHLIEHGVTIQECAPLTGERCFFDSSARDVTGCVLVPDKLKGEATVNNFEAAKKLVEMYGKYTKSNMDIDGKYAEAVARGAAALLYSQEEVTQHCLYEQESSK